MSRDRILFSFIAGLALAFGPMLGTASAEVRITFYAHSGAQIRSGWLYFPHAYIGLVGELDDGTVVDDFIGFTAVNPGLQLLLVSGPGELSRPDERYKRGSRRGISMSITDETYQVLRSRIGVWRTPEGSIYNVRRRNCITFVADAAHVVGLTVPKKLPLSPGRFMDELGRLNPEPESGSLVANALPSGSNNL